MNPTTTLGLTNDQLYSSAPSIFATEASEDVSDKYQFVDDYNPISAPVPYVESGPETAAKIAELESLLPEDYTLRRMTPPPPSPEDERRAELEDELADDNEIYNSDGEAVTYDSDRPKQEVKLVHRPTPTPAEQQAISQVLVNDTAHPPSRCGHRTSDTRQPDDKRHVRPCRNI